MGLNGRTGSKVLQEPTAEGIVRFEHEAKAQMDRRNICRILEMTRGHMPFVTKSSQTSRLTPSPTNESLPASLTMESKTHTLIGRASSLAKALLATTLLSAPAFAGQATSEAPSSTPLADWWNGKYMTGNWFGVRDTLAEHGLAFSGKWEGDFFGILDSKNGARGVFDQEVNFKGDVDFAKLTGLDSLKGLVAFGEVRYRQPLSPNANPATYIGATSMFNPSHFQSGTQWRLTNFGVGYTTPELFGIKNFLGVRGGWLQPSKEFAIQPLAQLFVNNAINSSRGIGGNIQWSSSYSAWGGTLQVKPTSDLYAKGGLFLAMPMGTATSNHGLAFEGYGPDTSRNGVMAVTELGYTPKFGENKLPGKYAVGGYFFGVDSPTYNGQTAQGQYGFYFQADQMIFREASAEPAPMGKGPSDGKAVASAGKSFKQAIPPTNPALNDQGLSAFNMVSFTPSYVVANRIPFYFQTGLVYKGLIPTRDKDQTMVALGFGSYNYNAIDNLQHAGNVNQPNYSAVIEGGYRVQINEWAYFQPFIQYIIKPNGTGDVQNATILGFSTALLF